MCISGLSWLRDVDIVLVYRGIAEDSREFSGERDDPDPRSSDREVRLSGDPDKRRGTRSREIDGVFGMSPYETEKCCLGSWDTGKPAWDIIWLFFRWGKGDERGKKKEWCLCDRPRLTCLKKIAVFGM